MEFFIEPPPPGYDFANYLRKRRVTRAIREAGPQYMTLLNFDEDPVAPACAIVVLLS